MKNINKLLEPAFPAYPSQDKFNQIVTLFPGMSKLEYYSFEIYKLQLSKIRNVRDFDNDLFVKTSFCCARDFIETLDEEMRKLLEDQKKQSPIVNI